MARSMFFCLWIVGWLLLGCGIQRDHDFGSGPATFDTTITAIRKLDSNRSVDSLRVGSINMSIGFPVSQLLFLDVSIDSIAYKSLDTIVTRWRHGRPDVRIQMMAQAIVEQKLDVIGMQEVLTFSLNDSMPQDFFTLLKAELEARTGQPWQGVRQILNDTVLQAKWANRSLKVAFAEGNALLIRAGITLSDTGSIGYQSLLPIEIEGAKPSMRCFNHAHLVTKGGANWDVYNTHLEVLEPYRSTQASEMVKAMNAKRHMQSAQIALGDFNDEPQTGATQIVAESGMLDSRDLAKVPLAGTCCVEDSKLWDGAATFSDRHLDYIFVHHLIGVVNWSRPWVSARPLPDNTVLWPSDHLMITATLISQ